MLGGEAHLGQHVRFGVIHEGGELGYLRPELVGDAAPLLAGTVGVVLGEGGGDERRHHAAPLAAGVGESFRMR